MNGECSCPRCNVCLSTGANLVEQAIEAAGLMLGSNKSRGYCLEMICAEFLAGANLDHGSSAIHFFKFLPGEQQRAFAQALQKSQP